MPAIIKNEKISCHNSRKQFFFFRMYPVVIGNGRNLQSDAVISGYNVPKGVRNFILCPAHCTEYTLILLLLQTHVIFPHLVVSNLQEYFPEPEKFLPERWIKRGEVGKKQNYWNLLREGKFLLSI